MSNAPPPRAGPGRNELRDSADACLGPEAGGGRKISFFEFAFEIFEMMTKPMAALVGVD